MNKLKQLELDSNLLNSVPGCVFIVDRDGTFQFISKSFAKYFQHSEKQLIGKKNWAILHKNKKFAKKVLALASKSNDFGQEISLIKKDRSAYLNTVSIKKLLNKTKKHLGYTIICQDISKSKHHEENLISSLERYISIFHNSNDIIYFLDGQGRFTEANARVKDILGKSEKDYVGKSFTEILHPDDIEMAVKSFKKGLQGKPIKPYLLRVKAKNNKIKTLEVRPSPLIGGKKSTGRFGIARDVSEMIKIEDDLKKSERKYRDIFQNANDIIFFVDSKGNFLDFNRRAEEFLGVKIEKMRGKKFTSIFSRESIPIAMKSFKKGMRGIDSDPYTIKAKGKKGVIRAFETRTSTIFENGKITGRFGVARDITEQTKSRKHLERAKAQLEAILNNIPDIAWLKDKDSKFIAVNKTLAKTLGLKPPDLTGKTDLDFYPKELAEMYRKDDREVMRTKKQKRVEEPYENKQGKRVWIETIKTPILDEKKKIIGTAGIARDITDKRLFQEALKKSEKKYKELTNSMPQVIFETDPKGNLIFVNKFAHSHFGYTQKDLKGGLNAFSMIVPKDRIKAKNRFAALIKKAMPGSSEYIALKKNGTTFPCIIHARPIFEGENFIGLRGMLIDISNLKKIENALRESEEKYRVLFDSSAEGILVADLKTTRCLYANDTVSKMFGYTPQQLTKQSVSDFHPKESLDYVLSQIKLQASGKKSLAVDIPCLRKNKTVFYADVNAARVIIGGRDCVVGFFTDVTERKALEKERIELSRLAAIGTLSASVAHEIRNPLFSISTIAQTIRKECSTQENKEVLQAMITEIARLENFVDDMLFYSKPKALSKRKFYPGKTLNEVLDINVNLFQTKGIKLILNNKLSKDRSLYADPLQIRRLFINLVANAFEASPRNGTITINAQAETVGKKTKFSFTFHNKGKYIAKGKMGSIFDLFYSSKPKGCGLGLPICKKIIESHSGMVAIKSSKERGTTFKITI